MLIITCTANHTVNYGSSICVNISCSDYLQDIYHVDTPM